MEVKAKLKHIKMSPRKVRLVSDVVRGLKTDKAMNQLKFAGKRAALPILKLVKSAIANAEHNFELDPNNLFIKEIMVDDAVTLKRWMPRAHGRATPIRKRASHISLILGEIEDSGKKSGKKQKVAAPIKLGDKPKEEGQAKVKKEGKTTKPVVPAVAEEKNIEVKTADTHGGHAKIEGKSHKGFTGKFFRRKSG
jgi:large subunit ribosomal protein L22